MKRIAIAAILASLALTAPAHAQAQSQADSNDIATLLAAHNAYRASLGLPPLHWSGALAAKAQGWADHLAATGQFAHDGPGQNLAEATAGSESLADLVNLWASERVNFSNGIFPAISVTGNWMDAGHYSQIVWRATTALGCGLAEAAGRDILVCDYAPPGNVNGERPY